MPPWARQIGPKGLEIVKSFEKLKLRAYLPTKDDVWTIGYGHTKGVRPGDTCTVEQAYAWLREDCGEAERAVNQFTLTPLSQEQFDALVSLTFNIGVGAFRRSTLLTLLDQRQYSKAAAQFDRWNKQKGNVLNGLTRRRKIERELFESVPAPGQREGQ